MPVLSAGASLEMPVLSAGASLEMPVLSVDASLFDSCVSLLFVLFTFLLQSFEIPLLLQNSFTCLALILILAFFSISACDITSAICL